MRRAPAVYANLEDRGERIFFHRFVEEYFNHEGAAEVVILLLETLEDEENEAFNMVDKYVIESEQRLKGFAGCDPELTFQWWLEQEYYRCVTYGCRDLIRADDEDDPRWEGEMRDRALEMGWWPKEIVKNAPAFVPGQESWH